MVELVVVLVMVGVLSAVAFPRLTQMSGYKDLGHRDQVKAVLAYARKAAVARRRYTCVVFNASSVATVTSELVTPDAHAGNCPYTALNLPSGGNTLTPPSNVTITAPALPFTIQFNAEGRPTVGVATSTTITLTDSSSGTSSSLIIEAESGYVH